MPSPISASSALREKRQVNLLSRRHLAPEKLIPRSLQSGEINEILGVKEPLKISSHDNLVGDPHIYIIIDKLERSGTGSFFYLVKDNEGNGCWQEKTINYPANLSGLAHLVAYPNPWDSRKDFLYNWVKTIPPSCNKVEVSAITFDGTSWHPKEKRPQKEISQLINYIPLSFHVIDQEICKMIKREGRQNFEYDKFPFFINYTRRVLLKGLRSQREYELYLKFGPSVSMEVFARQFLGIFNIFPPRAHLSEMDPYYVWIERVDGNPMFYPGFSLQRKLFQRVINERPIAAYYTLGNFYMLSLLGLSDAHSGNIFFSIVGETIPIDLETFGRFYNEAISPLIKNNPQISTKVVQREILGSIETLNSNYPIFSGLLPALKDAFIKGLQDMFSYLVKNRSLICERISGVLTIWGNRELSFRELFRDTGSYLLGGLDVCPHYNFLLLPEEIEQQVQNGLKIIQNAAENKFMSGEFLEKI